MTVVPELRPQVQGTFQTVLFLIQLPAGLFLNEYFGRYSFGLGAVGWIIIGAMGSMWVDHFIVTFFIGRISFSGVVTYFAWAVVALGIYNSLEIFCRSWHEDPVLSQSPGEPRTYLYDWALPKSLCSEEVSMRLVEPALTGAAAFVVAPWSGLLSTYLVVASFCMGLLFNLVYMTERKNIKQTKDMAAIGDLRTHFLSGSQGTEGSGSSEAGEVSGTMEIAFDMSEAVRIDPIFNELPEEYAAIELPRAYRGLAISELLLLDCEKLKELFGIRDLRVTCPGCSKQYKVRADQVGRHGRCRACGGRFAISDAA